MSDRSKLLKDARELADTLGRHRSWPVTLELAAATLYTLANLVEKYHKSNAQLIAACNAILAGPEHDADNTLEWAQGIIRAAPEGASDERP